MADDLERLNAVLADRYRIERQVGAGGMATVYLATDLKLDRQVALKVLKPDLAAALGGERFLREIKITAGLEHPYILSLHDSGEAGAYLYYVMPYVEGETLRDRLTREKQLPLEQALAIARDVGDALSYAHGRGVVHRDLKPENILMESGHAVVADFGIARAVSAAGGERLTETGLAVGTPAYMSPEQAFASAEADARSDLYSLGCVFYEMLAGHPPFTGSTAQEIIARHTIDQVPSLRAARPSVSASLQEIIGRLLAKLPADRFATAGQFLDALTGADHDRMKPARKSIAVLPFANLSADPENEYFSDGVTEDIIAQLAKISDVKVISRTSVMRYKRTDRSLREIGAELDVSSIVEGSVRRVCQHVRIVAQLIDVATDEHLWSETYDRELTDIFAIQSDVALHVAEALRATLSPSERARIEIKPTENVDAYNSYLLGRFHWNKRTELGFQRAIEHLQEAIAADPRYALAHAGLADCYNLLPFYGDRLPGETYPKAREAALRALQLNNALAEAHTSLAAVKQWFEWDWEQARQEFQHALQLSPGYATAHHWYAWFFIAQGDTEAALREARRVAEIDPLSVIANTDIGDLLYYARRYDEAIAQHRRALQLDPHFWISHLNLSRPYVQLGRFDDALAALDKAMEYSDGHVSCRAFRGYACAAMGKADQAHRELDDLTERSQHQPVASYLMAMICVGLHDLDGAFMWLQRALERRDSAWLLYFVAADPWADSLRVDPRFRRLSSAFNLLP